MFNLTGKKALVTGSTQGIGYAIAACLAGRGAEVIIHGISGAEKCRKASEGIPASSYAVADLSQEEGPASLYAQTGDADILVLNASVQVRKPWAEITPEEFAWQVQVNFKSALKLIQLYEPYMAKRGWGRIVTIGSVQQYKPHPDMLVYAATKAAQMSMVGNLAKQLGGRGITVNNVSPGVIATPRNDEALRNPQYREQILENIPARCLGMPEDCAGAVLLLCSDEGRYMTGTDLIVDGGMHL
ncbi:MAG: short-chain dehydrogenase [Paenibacillaceae bacterium]|nr:short-chain dehydrogenase [Paenibacillaceae bacterium]